MKEALKKIAEQFALEGAITSIDSLGEGFINDTFIVRTQGDAPDYILQRKNKEIFPDVPAMMENIRKVTEHIRRQVIAEGGDPMREAMTVVPTHDGKLCYEDEAGEFWAVTVFIADTIAYNKADSPELARKGGEGIGKFQAQLADFTEPLAETIKGFHNIRHRFVQWKCLRSDTVVIIAKIKKTKYIETNIIMSEPEHIDTSAGVTKKPLLNHPTTRYVAFTKNESRVKIMPGAIVISMS